jgi:hypothetical protein
MRNRNIDVCKVCGAAFAAFLLLSGQGLAADVFATETTSVVGTIASQKGTMAYAPSEDWAEKLSALEMAELRGGMFGIGFSFFGTLDTTSAVTGNLAVNTEALVAPPVVTPGGEISFGTSLGTNSFNGFNGVLQHLSVTGNGNVVGQNLYMNIFLLRDSNPNNISSLMDTLAPRL